MPSVVDRKLPNISSKGEHLDDTKTKPKSKPPDASSVLVVNSAWNERYEDSSSTVKGLSELNARQTRSRSPSPKARQHASSDNELLKAENPGLYERRQALAQAAFVRHSTAELVENLRQEPGVSSQHSARRRSSIVLPGNLYHHDSLTRAAATGVGPRPLSSDDVSSLPSTPSSSS
eukprot:CAMPEP_0202910116 /NCGR_PEP_ID=MMETSP1392-20130828/51153_1 /ASSEMBLY_ACC=CAM_ASM_000868 /TAXON_ID=225041 /ORGANISM="Chlamydomonas chlamydogama, Strain SAG 11-48b" /LENGTH=175 /DNA_ID=CAMNT_0049600111 /DNA_START=102 /DNA_END=626 /DNA_ORIENTATION=+